METMMNRRTLIGTAAAVAAFPVLNRVASAQTSLKTYKGFPHGMPTTQAETINADLLAFLKA